MKKEEDSEELDVTRRDLHQRPMRQAARTVAVAAMLIVLATVSVGCGELEEDLDRDPSSDMWDEMSWDEGHWADDESPDTGEEPDVEDPDDPDEHWDRSDWWRGFWARFRAECERVWNEWWSEDRHDEDERDRRHVRHEHHDRRDHHDDHHHRDRHDWRRHEP